MALYETEALILKAIHFAGGTPTTKELSTYLPKTLKNISSRLCDLRKRGLAESEMSESGVNQWMLTDDGLAALKAGITLDTDDAPEPAVSEPIQPDSPDILPDIPEPSPDPIAADFAAALDAADEVVDAEWPDFGGNPPVCADANATADVAPDLIEEANSIRLRRPLPREQDAIYVLSVLIDVLGRDHPGMAYELTRIAAYIEGEYA